MFFIVNAVQRARWSGSLWRSQSADPAQHQVGINKQQQAKRRSKDTNRHHVIEDA
jgi:hypothetical protein